SCCFPGLSRPGTTRHCRNSQIIMSFGTLAGGQAEGPYSEKASSSRVTDFANPRRILEIQRGALAEYCGESGAMTHARGSSKARIWQISARAVRKFFNKGQSMSTIAPKDTPTASTVVRAVATAACVLAGSQSAAAQSELGAQLVDDLHTAFGKHHARAAHAKGVILEGSFTPAR